MAIAVRGSKKKGAQVHIDGELTIYTAAESKAVLMEVVAAYKKIHLNLEALEEIDTAGVQLLLMLRREAELAGAMLTLSTLSPALKDVVALLNIKELIAIEPAADDMTAAEMPT